MKYFVAFIALFLLWGNLFSQNFTIKVDTVVIPATNYATATSTFELTRLAKCRNCYFCCFQQDEVNMPDLKRNHLLAISLDGKTVKSVPFPRAVDGDTYFDLFSRHDTLYARPYWEFRKPHFRFDFEQWKWDTIPFISNMIYENDDWQVIYDDMGEWGDWAWFQDKESGNQYLWSNANARIVRKEGNYYMLESGCLNLISNPTQSALCDDSLRPENRNILNNTLQAAREGASFKSPQTVFCFRENEDEWDPWGPSYDTTFRNMWLVNNQLYFWTQTKDHSFISTIENGRLKGIVDLPENYQTFVWSNSFRGNNQGDNQFQMQFSKDLQTCGIIDVVDSSVTIHYLIHNLDTLRPLGENLIAGLLECLFIDIDNLDIASVFACEKSVYATPSGIVNPVSSSAKIKEEDQVLRQYFCNWVDKSTLVVSSYDFNRSDSLVVRFEIQLQKPNGFNASSRSMYAWVNFESELYQQLKTMFTQYVGRVPRVDGKRCEWTFRGHTLTLDENSILYEKN